MTKEDIDASEAPLLDHLIELRKRLIYCVVGFGFFSSIFIKSSLAISPDAKRRLRLLYWGATVALVPLFGITLVALVRGKSMYDLFPDWLIGLGLIMTTIFPLTLAYVIVVQRAMDVRVLVRTGTKYLLAKATLVGLQVAVLAFLVLGVLLPLLQRRDAWKRHP